MKTEAYINKIIENTGLTRNEIQQLVEEKKVELKGLISDEGALFIVAEELGVDVKEESKSLLENIDIKVSDVTSNMKNITLIGRIKEIYDLFTFNRSDGGIGKVSSFLLHDDSGDIRVVLWDDHVNIFKENNFTKNELVKIVNGYAKKGKYEGVEIHIGNLSKVILSPEDVDYKNYPKVKEEYIPIGNIDLTMKSISIEGKIIQKFPIKEFIKKDGESGKVGSLFLLDSTGSIRITFWNDDTNKINDIEVEDYVSITNLNPRLSNLDSTRIDLFASSSSFITKKDHPIHLEVELVEKIEKLQSKQNIVSFKGVIYSIDDLKSVTSKSGEELTLLNFIVSDDTDAIRVSVWRDKAEEFSKRLAVGQGVILKNVLLKTFAGRKQASFRKSSILEKIDLKISNLKGLEPIADISTVSFKRNYTKIDKIDSSNSYEIKGSINEDITDKNILIYDACSKCLRKIDRCVCQESGSPIKRMIIKLFVDDDSETIRTIFFNEQAEKLLGKNAEEISKKIDNKNFLDDLSKRLRSKELAIKGDAEFNNYNNINRYELKVKGFQDIDVNAELEDIMKEIEI
ncbi:MAG: hypothetical protein ACFE9T_15120 [Promethearchaeota archaeon]